MKKFFPALLLLSFTALNVCLSQQSALKNYTIDTKATAETKALFFNLKNLSGKGVLFGQQDALMYGIGWKGEFDKSDVKSITGSHPSLFGWDLEAIAKSDSEENQTQNAEKLKSYCLQAFKMGGVNTLSWHVQNFVTGKNFYDTTKCVSSILPGGTKHKEFTKALDKVALLIKSLKNDKGISIPVIFRPFHENTGNWFWWGKPFCTAQEYKDLWQFTVQYLRDKKGLHNVLYAYSPDRISGNLDNYMERYPGDNYVDVLGFDNYYELKDINDQKSVELAVKSMGQICNYASSKNKIAALTETGQEKIVQTTWFTTIFNRIMSDTAASKISYMMVWRNAHTGHFYAPYPGHPSVENFKDFYNNPKTLFLKDVGTSLYKIQ
ncbi:glycoside hydrolase family 26 protein [Pedobacter mendelii]|uniref:Mannan endo-1,4-beta-mannosidase n=1 Tax=Pedobacter mendelii TaxID=1908240 RepID=A0ABQ2BG20_9SPHI|nr:glycosyl hydrolase [Pedobacter mendelii]GGI25340.1 mannan endo-1,4-beta-mannosidase [Pedobacter mendelii]